MRSFRPSPRRSALILAAIALAACRDRTPAPADSSLAQDLALAQRQVVAPEVFNDAPAGGNAAASPAKAAPTPRPEPPRAKAPSPRPSPRRDNPPAPIQRTPQHTPPHPVDVEPTPSPSPAPAPAAGVIGSGSRVGMATNSRVCTVNLLPGDKVTATVTSGIAGSNGASIPAGATVVLEVASVDRGDPIENTRIQFRVRSVDVNGEPYAVSGEIASLGSLERVQAESANDKQKVIGGAVAGAVIGRIFGHSTKATVIGAAAGAAAGTVAAKHGQESDACLPQGSPMRMTISRDIVVRRSAI